MKSFPNGNAKNLTALYLHSDLSAVAIFEEDTKKFGRLKYVELFEKFLPPSRANIKEGVRLVIHNTAIALLLRDAIGFCVYPNNNTAKADMLNLNINSIYIETKYGDLKFDDIPGFCSGGFTYQESGYNSDWNAIKDLIKWGDYHVSDRHPVNG
jgi:hypothetical protein